MISKRPHLFTSESVTEGHPDKMADQISDAILDAFLEQDKDARVAVECVLKTGLCLIAGEVRTTAAHVPVSDIARKKIEEIGYVDRDHGFDGKTCAVLVALEGQSEDIARGVDATTEKEQGAGDQGLMFGFACDETPELMPFGITYADALAKRLASVRKSKILPFLGPDGKTQVTVLYENMRPVGIKDVVISSQHLKEISHMVIREAIIEEVIKKTIKKEHLLPNVSFHINPTGAFVIGAAAHGSLWSRSSPRAEQRRSHRTQVAPSSMAVSRSCDIPIERPLSPCRSPSSRKRRKCGRAASGSSDHGGMVIRPVSARCGHSCGGV